MTLISDLVVTEDYTALTILKEDELQNQNTSIETWANTKVKLNLSQFILDVFGGSYVLNDDGIATLASPLADLAAKLADNETVTGAWTFSGATTFSNTVSSSSTFTSTGQNKCRAYRTTSAQAIATATATAISFGAESFDTGSMHDNSTNPTRITIPTGGSGVYVFNGQVQFAADATGYRDVMIYKNGSLVAKHRQIAASGSLTSDINVSFIDTANANDYYELYVYQNSGSDVDVNFGENITFFSALKVW